MKTNAIEIYRMDVLPRMRDLIPILADDIRSGLAFPLGCSRAGHGYDHTARVAVLSAAMIADYRDRVQGSCNTTSGQITAAVLHDACRRHEIGDFDHGRIAAGRYVSHWSWAIAQPGSWTTTACHPGITQAIAYHGERGLMPDAGATAKILALADRLDLPRFGYTIDPTMMYAPTPAFPIRWRSYVDLAAEAREILTFDRVMGDINPILESIGALKRPVVGPCHGCKFATRNPCPVAMSTSPDGKCRPGEVSGSKIDLNDPRM